MSNIRSMGPAPAEKEPETESQRVIRDANATLKKTFGGSRSLVIKNPEVLAQFRLIEVIGPELAKNQTWVNMALPLLFVIELDGIKVNPPNAKMEVEALIKRLGNDGFDALGAAIVELAGPQTDSEGALKNS